ncbi:hypothetical protein [Vulcanococcus limneticus]|uniref:hypothetical protein n=1 Tax=Vulcanococcus limneticus TaxID=2170428 RepID=UPI000B989141|nr:hypothetical protein [Vulcanococcus limneticus]MCP9791292.1 hypothetical protein [Vulcanococcus limneticus MW73D5]MCP9893322.1 hypothetical protein [Vulcanococcus limneticus Candia 3F8]MCP9896661.1 hypothetical protein [Vulcanococcus limneticus Candia 3B3]
MTPPFTTKLVQLAWVWGLALGLSALLRWAGVLWPNGLAVNPELALVLVLVPPALMGLALLRGLLAPPPPGAGAPLGDPGRGESSD